MQHSPYGFGRLWFTTLLGRFGPHPRQLKEPLAWERRRARGGEISQRRNAFGPGAATCPPQIRADECLGAMLERVLDRNHDHRRGLLAVDSKTPLEGGIGADPCSTIDPIGLVRAPDRPVSLCRRRSEREWLELAVTSHAAAGPMTSA